MDRWKSRGGKSQRGEEKKREDQRGEREGRKKRQVLEEVGKSRFMFFQWFVAPDGGKVSSLKRRVRSQLARWEMKNCTLLWREAHFEVKKVKSPHVRNAFWSWDVEQVPAVVARSTFPSQNVQKHTMFGPLLEVQRSKKCTPLWCEAHFQVKMYKAHHVQTTFWSWDVEQVHAIVVRSTFPSQNVQNTPWSDNFWKFRGRKKCMPLWCEARFQVKMYKAHHVQITFGSWDVKKVHTIVAGSTFPSHKCKKLTVRTTLGRSDVVFRGRRNGLCTLSKVSKRNGFVSFSTTATTTIHFTTLHYTTLHYTTLHNTTLHYIFLQYTTLHYTTLHPTRLHYTTLLYTTLH